MELMVSAVTSAARAGQICLTAGPVQHVDVRTAKMRSNLDDRDRGALTAHRSASPDESTIGPWWRVQRRVMPMGCRSSPRSAE
jgi:hypothetical protein